MSFDLEPPIAPRIFHVHSKHGDERQDPYHWLNDRSNPNVISYLESENLYADHALSHLSELRNTIFSELKSRIVESFTTAPIKEGDYEYYSRVLKGQNYYAHYRQNLTANGPEELLIDENELAENQDYFRLYELDVCPADNILAYSEDLKGNSRCTIKFLNLRNRQHLSDEIIDASGNFVWSNCSKYLFYSTLNQSNRPFRLYRHRLGTDPEHDLLIYEECDDSFYLDISKSTCKQYIYLTLENQITSEVHFFSAGQETVQLQLIFERSPNIRYSVQHRAEDLFVLTNENAVNFRLMKTSALTPNKSNWTTVIAHSNENTLGDFQVFKDFIAISERIKGLPCVRILSVKGNDYSVKTPNNLQELHLGTNLEFDTKICRIYGNSLTTPRSWLDLRMDTGKSTVLKVKEVGGEYDAENYQTEQHFIKSHDGTKVPVYLAYNKLAVKQRPAPLLLYAYGAYGISYPLHFSSTRLSILDRGVIYAVAHVRGGGELGENWYQNGKLMTKKNTFYDFSACADYLLENKFTSSEKLAVMGESAGGLPIGYFINSSPRRCQAALASVPFVDVLTTILNDDLPLSVLEQDEWGNPNVREFYHYIKSYSPYDNVGEMEYPALYITGGFHDPNVGYWEPAKWAAKIRHCKTDTNTLILKTEMKSGHSGKSGRYHAMQDTATECAFLLDQLNCHQLAD